MTSYYKVGIFCTVAVLGGFAVEHASLANRPSPQQVAAASCVARSAGGVWSVSAPDGSGAVSAMKIDGDSKVVVTISGGKATVTRSHFETSADNANGDMLATLGLAPPQTRISAYQDSSRSGATLTPDDRALAASVRACVGKAFPVPTPAAP